MNNIFPNIDEENHSVKTGIKLLVKHESKTMIPKLSTPELSTNYTRERWIQEAFEKNGSESARDGRKDIVARLDHYCNKVHQMSPEQVFEWINANAKDEATKTQFAVDFLSKYVKFCQEDHRDIILGKGRKNKNGTVKLNSKNYLKKLHPNSILGRVSRTRQFMSQVGGIRIHNDDFKRIPIPLTVKRGQYDDEEAEPLTAEMARKVCELTQKPRPVALYHFMNDTGFRIAEAGMVIESDFDFEANPPTVKVPKVAVKGVMARGVRYMRDSTAEKIKKLLKNEPKRYVFRSNNSQSVEKFRKSELVKIKRVYDQLGMTQIYEDTGRRKFNMHSWRKRCSTEYARSNSESISDGYLRHSKYLAQYHLTTKQERVEAFRRAEIDLEIEETEKLKLQNESLERLQSNEIKKLQNSNYAIMNLVEDLTRRLLQTNSSLDKTSIENAVEEQMKFLKSVNEHNHGDDKK